MRKRLASLLALLLLVALCAPALEIKQGLLKLVIDETNARILIYRLVDIAKGRYESFLFEQDPRTSYATLSFEGKQSKLGDSAEYRIAVSQVEGGARIEFRSSSCVVTEDLQFVSSADATLADGLRVTYTMENISQRDAAIGLRLLLDCWLGEKSQAHFRTDQRPKLTEELLLDSRSPDTWISSPGDKAELMILLTGLGLVRPDQVIFANWKRLNDEPWNLDVVPGRSFTLLPYSVNDSAVALYWQPTVVAKGTNRVVATIVGSFNEKGYPVRSAAVDAATAALFAKSVLQGSSTDLSTALQSDLVTARDLISQIDQAIAAGRPLTVEQVAAWRRILDALEERKKGY
jgi:hypothetical protein